MIDGEEHPVAPASITAIRIVALAWIAGLGTINVVGLGVAAIFADRGRGWFLTAMLVAVVVVALAAAFAVWWPSVRYRYLRYRADDNGLLIRRGVVWRSIISIPLSRVQHTDVSQGPLQRSYGLATLTVHTAGTQNASIELGGLEHGVALALRDHLVSSDEPDAV